MTRKPSNPGRNDALAAWRRSVRATLDEIAAKLGAEDGARVAADLFAECARAAFIRVTDESPEATTDSVPAGPVARASLRFDYRRIVGESAALLAVLKTVDRVIDSNLTVLVLGESGTGKELIARAIHENSPRKDRVFVRENCAAIPESLLESELFGHRRGSFTGATGDKKGLFEEADGGSVFLDEIGEMSVAMQAKLMRVLQEGEIRPVGSSKTVHVDVRLIAATNRDLRKLLASGRFREDLFFRLNVVSIVMPPLRDRKDDIPMLVAGFLDTVAERTKTARKSITPAAVEILVAHAWPGNVRELENEIRRACAMSGPTIKPSDLSDDVAPGRSAPRKRPSVRKNP